MTSGLAWPRLLTAALRYGKARRSPGFPALLILLKGFEAHGEA
jgi:hypothetical protein